MANIQENGSNKITSYDVARHAGVSQMSVSRVLRKAPNISKKLIEKVEKSIAQLGYVHNQMAANLSENSNIVGVIIPTLKNRNFNDVLEGINATIDGTPLQSIFGLTSYSLAKEEELVYKFLSLRPKSIIITGLEHTSNTRTMLKNSDIPIIEIMDSDSSIDPIHSLVGFDNYQLGWDMAHHLIDKGYRRFAFVGAWLALDNQMDYRAQKRYTGFTEALQKNGLDWVMQKQSPDMANPPVGQAMMDEIVQHKDNVDVVYCSGDDLATGVYLSCMKHNVSIPNDLAVVGCNGLSLLNALPQQITTTRTPRYEMGCQAIEYILSGNKTPMIKTLPCPIVGGETS